MNPQTAHIEQGMNEISLAYEGGLPFVSEEFAPVVGVKKKSDRYFKFSKEQWRIYQDSIAEDGTPQTIQLDLEPMGFYNTEGHALAIPVSDVLRDNADEGVELDIEVNQKLTRALRLAQENDSVAFLTTNFITQNVTKAGTSKWSDYVNSDPIADIDLYKETVMQSIGVEPRNLLLPRPVFRNLRSHPRVYNRAVAMGLSNGGKLIGEEQIAGVFDVDKVIVPKVVYLTSARGQQDTAAFLYGNFALLYYSTNAPARRTPNFMYTFVWTKRTYDMKIVRDEYRDKDLYKCQKYRDVRLIEPNAGFLINTPN